MSESPDLLDACEEAAESLRGTADVPLRAEQLDEFFFYLGGAIAHHVVAAAEKNGQPGVVDSLLEGFSSFRRNKHKETPVSCTLH